MLHDIHDPYTSPLVFFWLFNSLEELAPVSTPSIRRVTSAGGSKAFLTSARGDRGHHH
jgi:hypothetical protein